MSDWQAGDYALCIYDGPWDGEEETDAPGPRCGQIHEVEEVGVCGDGPLADELGLAFAPWNFFFVAECFRKVSPCEADAEDRETITLLNGKPAREMA